jgi:hypothetical protein
LDADEDRYLVCLVCLVFWLNQINQRDQMNQIHKTNQINQMNRSLSDRRKVANNDLGNFLKIAVRCQDRKPMLHGTGGNRGAGFLQGNADGWYRSDVSSSTTSTLTREDSRNSRNSRSLFSRLLPWRKPARSSPSTIGLTHISSA